MHKFLVVYLAPAEGLEAWAAMDPAVTRAEEEKMKAAWDTWVNNHQSLFVGETVALGKTKRVTADGVSDTKNGMMLYSVIEAASHEAAAEVFKDHPHFGIPGASIEVMPMSFLSEMEAK